ncbi:transmembrane protein 81 [Pyxicephalus adspersus]|uniref:transmembrane protein 81 n=1 Tax=Pyxicephalus adspersus TaxID=30357 RepID=UPI003B5935A6
MRSILVLLAMVLSFSSSVLANIDLGPLEKALLELAKHATKNEKTLVKSTECDVICGIGSKIETRCFVKQEEDGLETLHLCEDITVKCYGVWECGMRSYHLNIGSNVELDCQSKELGEHQEESMTYRWIFAPGIITKEDINFDTYMSKGRTLKLFNIQERDAGTYQCQMEDSTEKLIKVIHFAIRVIDPKVFDLNINRILTKEKEKKKLFLKERLQEKWETLTFKDQLIIILAMGISGSVLVCIIIGAAYYSWKRMMENIEDMINV